MRPKLAFAGLCILLTWAGARADFRVGDTIDEVYLVDGTKIEGTVIAVGIKAVVLVVKGEEEGEAKEIVIAKEKVERIVRGEPARDTASFKTDVVDGTKKVTGQGFRDEDAEPLAPAAKPEPGKPAGARDRNLEKKLEGAMGSNAMVKRLVTQAGGVEQAAQLLKSNPQLRSRLDDYIRQGGGAPNVQRSPRGPGGARGGGGGRPRMPRGRGDRAPKR